LTSLGLFSFHKGKQRFRLESVHPGHSVEEILDNTGFEFDRPPAVPATPAPEPHVLDLVRGLIREEIAETYPRFAATLAG
jgi:glutaconate CoA-transferase subunit B